MASDGTDPDLHHRHSKPVFEGRDLRLSYYLVSDSVYVRIGTKGKDEGFDKMPVNVGDASDSDIVHQYGEKGRIGYILENFTGLMERTKTLNLSLST